MGLAGQTTLDYIITRMQSDDLYHSRRSDPPAVVKIA